MEGTLKSQKPTRRNTSSEFALILRFHLLSNFCLYSLIMKWRFTDRVGKQMDAFLKVSSIAPFGYLIHSIFFSILQGFSDLIPLPLIKIFDERELEVSTSINFFAIAYYLDNTHKCHNIYSLPLPHLSLFSLSLSLHATVPS